MVSDTFEASLYRVLSHVWAADPIADPIVEARARYLLLDTLGCAITGLATVEARTFASYLGQREPGRLVIPGLDEGLSVSAFLMAFSAAACAFEGPEGLASAQGRPGLHAVPAVLADGLDGSTDLRAVLDAIVAGYEVGGRIGQAYRILPGMHVDGTWGTFAAAAAIARLHRLPIGIVQAAIDIAACQLPLSLYHPIRKGSVARNLYSGHGATLASHAVAAAASGTPRAPGSLAEHMSVLLGSVPNQLPSACADGRWLIEEGYLKMYPVVKHTHYGIEAATRWRNAGGRVKSGDRIILSIYRNAIKYCGNRAPRTAIEAQFSLSWSLAWALLHGGLSTEAFAPQSLEDPDLRGLESAIEIIEDETLTAEDRRGATLTIAAAGREPQVTVVSNVPGDPEMPLMREELVGKFLAGTVPVIGSSWAHRVVKAVLDGRLDRPLDLG